MSDIDWLGYELQKKNKFTYHHIVKKEHKGKRTIDNGAILINVSHAYVHLIELVDFDMYVYLNNLLKNINTQRTMPTKQQLLAINYLLEQFERENCGKVNRKGAPLIKEEYTKRIIRRR